MTLGSDHTGRFPENSRPQKQRRVVHITSVHTATDIRIFQKECRSLVKCGYEVILIAPKVQPGTVGGVTVVPLPGARGRLRRMLIGWWRAFAAAMPLHAEIYHLHDPELLPCGQLLRLFRRCVVFDMHENLPAAILNKGWLPRFLREPISAIVSVFERLFLMGMPVVFAEWSYVKFYPRVKKSAVVLNMPLVEELQSINVTRRLLPTVGYFGAVSSLRGSIVLIEALRLLKISGVLVGLELIGPIQDEHRKEVVALVTDYGLSEVYIRGYLEPKEGWEIMGQCTIGAALLAPIPNYIDSYPTKIFEYMALGLPILASNFPLYKSIVEDLHCGYCVDPEEPDEVARMIHRLLENDELARKLGENGRAELSARFNWANEVQKLVGLYEDIL